MRSGLFRIVLTGLLASALGAQPAPPPQIPGAPPPPALPAAPSNTNGASDPLGDLNVVPPVQPGTGGSNPPPAATAASDPWSTLEGMLGRIQALQKQALDAVESYKAAKDESERQMLMRDIQVWHGTVEGMLLSSTWKDTVEKVRATDDLAKTKDARYLAMFGEKGHLPTVDRNQEILRAFLKDPLAPATTQGGDPAAGSGSDSIAKVQDSIDRISLELAKPGLTEARRGELEAERTRLVERIRQLSGSPPTSPTGVPIDGGGATAPTGSTGTSSTEPESSSPGHTAGSGAPTGPTSPPPDPGLQAPVSLVPNSYGVMPQVMTDAQIRAALDPLIAKELAQVNAKSGAGMQMNKYRQMVGSSGKTTVRSLGKPDYDHYREWLKASPALKAQVDAQAQAILAERARTAASPPRQDPASSSGGAGQR